MIRTDRLDYNGGQLTLEVVFDEIRVTVASPIAAGGFASHHLDAEDAVGIAHWLLREAHRLGDERPEVAVALLTLEDLGHREEAQQ